MSKVTMEYLCARLFFPLVILVFLFACLDNVEGTGVA
jgi:hypothetical protein